MRFFRLALVASGTLGVMISAQSALAFRSFGSPHAARSYSGEGTHERSEAGGWRGGRHQRDLPQYHGNPRHLGGWLQRHGDMPFADQEKALRQQQGFERLSPEMQQRLLDRLKQIDQMPPRERERTVDRIEAMERLSPAQRRRVRSSVKAIHDLPPDRRRMVRSAFRSLRNDPPEERQEILSSPEFKQKFSRRERNMLSNVLKIEPYEPPPAGRAAPQ